jgi:hypothetical protein
VFDGHIENGVVVFDQPVPLPDGTPVRVEPLTKLARREPEPTSEPRSFLDRYRDVIGKPLDLPADGSANIDHYLYGQPKK